MGYGAASSVRRQRTGRNRGSCDASVSRAPPDSSARTLAATCVASRSAPVRVTYRDERRLERLGRIEVEPVRADVLDRAALRRAFRGCELVFHAAGYVGSRPAERVVGGQRAVAPRGRGGRRGRGRQARGGHLERRRDRAGAARSPRHGGRPLSAAAASGSTYPDAKHEGESEALAAGRAPGRGGRGGQPVLRARRPRSTARQPGETSTRLDRQLPARAACPPWWTRETNFVDVRDVARGPPAARPSGARRGALRARRPRPAAGSS